MFHEQEKYIESGPSADRLRMVHVDLVVLFEDSSMNKNTLLKVVLAMIG